MPWLKCLICGKDFYAKPNHLKVGWGKYCSNKCKFISQKKGKIVECSNCGKRIYRIPSDFINSKSGLFFCNKSCHCSWMNKEPTSRKQPSTMEFWRIILQKNLF